VRRDWNPPLSQNIEDRRDEPPYVPDWTERGRNRDPTPREILEQQRREDTPNPYWTPRLDRQTVPEMARGGSVKRSARRARFVGADRNPRSGAWHSTGRQPRSPAGGRNRSGLLGGYTGFDFSQLFSFFG